MMRVLWRRSPVLLVIGLVGLSACSGDTFRAASSGNGGGPGGGTAGDTASAGAAGTADGGTAGGDSGGNAGASGEPQGGTSGSAGGVAGIGGGGSGGGTGGSAAGMGGSSGAGGSQGVVCSASVACVGAGEYCNLEAGLCARCDDLSRIVVGKPVELLPAAVGANRYYPRVVEVPDGFLLTYRLGTNSPEGDIRAVRSTTGDFSTSPDYPVPPPISALKGHDSGAFVLPTGLSGSDFGVGSGDLNAGGYRYALLDSDRNDVGARRSLFLARLPTPTDPLTGRVESLGSDVNGGSNKGDDDFSPAFAADTKRLYWMRSRTVSGTAKFSIQTRKLGALGTGGQVQLPERACPATKKFLPGNYAPWVTPDGRRLFYQQSCGDEGSGTSALFHIKLDAGGVVPEGEPLKIELPIADGVEPPAYDRTPSLSPDQCTLYWEREGRLMSAPRQ